MLFAKQACLISLIVCLWYLCFEPVAMSQTRLTTWIISEEHCQHFGAIKHLWRKIRRWNKSHLQQGNLQRSFKATMMTLQPITQIALKKTPADSIQPIRSAETPSFKATYKQIMHLLEEAKGAKNSTKSKAVHLLSHLLFFLCDLKDLLIHYLQIWACSSQIHSRRRSLVCGKGSWTVGGGMSSLACHQNAESGKSSGMSQTQLWKSKDNSLATTQNLLAFVLMENPKQQIKV